MEQTKEELEVEKNVLEDDLDFANARLEEEEVIRENLHGQLDDMEDERDLALYELKTLKEEVNETNKKMRKEVEELERLLQQKEEKVIGLEHELEQEQKRSSMYEELSRDLQQELEQLREEVISLQGDLKDREQEMEELEEENFIIKTDNLEMEYLLEEKEKAVEPEEVADANNVEDGTIPSNTVEQDDGSVPSNEQETQEDDDVQDVEADADDALLHDVTPAFKRYRPKRRKIVSFEDEIENIEGTETSMEGYLPRVPVRTNETCGRKTRYACTCVNFLNFDHFKRFVTEPTKQALGISFAGIASGDTVSCYSQHRQSLPELPHVHASNYRYQRLDKQTIRNKCHCLKDLGCSQAYPCCFTNRELNELIKVHINNNDIDTTVMKYDPWKYNLYRQQIDAGDLHDLPF
eukprot:g2498.t1